MSVDRAEVSPSERPPAYLCYKEAPREFMLLKLVGTTPEEFERFASELSKQPGVNSSTTHLVRVDMMSVEEIENLMRGLGLITEENEREVLANIGSVGSR